MAKEGRWRRSAHRGCFATESPRRNDPPVNNALAHFFRNITGKRSIAPGEGQRHPSVYSHFGAKDGLFEAIVEDKCQDLMGPVRLPAITDGNPTKTLSDLARRSVTAVFTSPNMALFRVVIVESARFPELAEAFYRAGPAAAIDNLAGYLIELDRKGNLAIRDAKASARLFFAMLRGDVYIRRLLDLKPEPSAAEKEALVGQAVAAFLAAHAPD